MIFTQYYLACLSHASYLIGDETTGRAVVVDPRRDVNIYLDEAAEHGLHIERVIETHIHADFLSGHLELAAATGAVISYCEGAEVQFPIEPLRDGQRLSLGEVTLEILATPGHTPESICVVVYEHPDDAVPYGLLTGDTLFVGDVGRPDLLTSSGVSADSLARKLYRSLHDKLLQLPDATRVFPAHGAGSACGKQLSSETSSTIGEQRRTNYALQPMSKTAFVDLVTADQPDAPAYFTYDAVLNTKERATLDESLARELNPMTLEQVVELQKAGCQALDTRDPDVFAAAHLAGSINIGLGGQFATWAGTVLSRESPIVILAVPGHEKETAMRLGRIGFDNVSGYLEGGLSRLAGRPDLTASTQRISPALAAEFLESQELVPVDVRTPAERKAKSIGGSLGVPLNHLTERMHELPRNRPLLVHCAGGYRSSVGASLLQRAGFTEISEIAGGLAAWEAAGLQLERPSA